MAEQKRIEAPDFAGILNGKPRATHDAIRLLYEAANLAFDRIDRRRLLWRDVEYASGLFSASAGTWTVSSADLVLYRYIFADRLLLVSFAIENSTTSGGMGTDLYLNLPLNLSANSPSFTGILVVEGNITEIGYLSTRASTNETSIALRRVDGSSWPSSVTDDLDLRGMIAVEIL